MKKIKCGLIVSDFDGTLLTGKHEVPAKVRSAISEYVLNGGIFAVCTGRMLRSILPRVRELGLKGIVVAYQGTVIAEIESGKIIKDGGITGVEAAEICRALQSRGCFVNVYADENLYTDIPKDNEYLKLYESITGVDAINVSGLTMDKFVAERDLFCRKVASLVAPKEQERLYKSLSLELGGRYDVTCSANCLIEVSPLCDNKGTALEFLAAHYQIPIEKTVAVGDNLNDLSMIEKAGIGVAVGNATQALKEKADYVSVTNDECAVAEIINKYGFEESDD